MASKAICLVSGYVSIRTPIFYLLAHSICHAEVGSLMVELELI